MIAYDLRVTLVSEAAFTADGATTGAATTLPYVPGSTLFGAAAAALAPTRGDGLSQRDFFRAFVAGEVTFSEGLPDVGGEIAVPMPLSLHAPKQAGPNPEAVNLARVARPPGQLEQLRSGFVTSSGRRFTPEVRHGLRTAIAPDGRARDRHLYGLATLPAGLVFRARLSGDDPTLVARVRDAIVGRARLGRSRGAELGVTEITVEEAPSIPVASGTATELVLLCASDLALRDASTGAPTLAVTPARLNLPDGFRIAWDRTFVRTRRYSPFNGHRRRPDLERQVLVAGSVITVTAPSPVHRDEVRQWLAPGVGEWRHQGLGRLLVDPVLLAGPTVALRGTSAPEARDVPPPGDPLWTWAHGRVQERLAEEAAASVVDPIAHAMAQHRISRAQWGTIRQLARRVRRAGGTPETLAAALRAHLDDGRTKELWSTRRRGRTAAEALQESIAEATAALEHHGALAQVAAVEILAGRVARKQAQEEGR